MPPATRSSPPPSPEASSSRENHRAFQDYPVVGSPQSEADALCAYEGKRLPSEAEWEKAGRGGCELVAPEYMELGSARQVLV